MSMLFTYLGEALWEKTHMLLLCFVSLPLKVGDMLWKLLWWVEKLSRFDPRSSRYVSTKSHVPCEVSLKNPYLLMDCKSAVEVMHFIH